MSVRSTMAICGLAVIYVSCVVAAYASILTRDLSLERHARPHSVANGGLPTSYNPTVQVNTAQLTRISPLLYGIFFEEINHAGDGGLYAEFVYDRSFDELALKQQIASGKVTERLVNWANSSSSRLRAGAAAGLESTPGLRDDSRKAWHTVGDSTSLSLDRSNPVKPGNPVAALVEVSSATTGGLTNTGYWGMSIRPDIEYKITFWAYCSKGNVSAINVTLHSYDGATTYAATTVHGLSGSWQKFAVVLQPSSADSGAALSLTYKGPGSVVLDVVSMFKAESSVPGQMNPYPFRLDLLQALRDLKPRFIRFPGGCYVEGNELANRFNWRTAVGPIEARPGHWNQIWGYWSTDGLGLYEFMLLCEELGAEAIYVFNAGVAHSDSIPGSQLWPWVQDVMDAIEYITGPPTSTWGKVRASMGHVEPFKLKYLAIGNEDCGKPSYESNYLIFYSALKTAHPGLRLISNCPMDSSRAPTDVYDDHRYMSQVDMWKSRGAFNYYNRQDSARIFMSEYAAVGIADASLIAAVSEAGFMTGLDRNGDIVELASYAPLLSHSEDRRWVPDLIYYNSSTVVLTPSYHVQRLFSQYMGTHYAATQVQTSYRDPLVDGTLASSATCQDEACTKLVVKVVNIASIPAVVSVTISSTQQVAPNAMLWLLTSPAPYDENSLSNPAKVSPRLTDITNATASMKLSLPAYSVAALMLELKPASA